MAYSYNNQPVLQYPAIYEQQGIVSPLPKTYTWNGMDSVTVLQSQGYIANGKLLGMIIGDIIWYICFIDLSLNGFVVTSVNSDESVNITLSVSGNGGNPPSGDFIITQSGQVIQTQSGVGITTQQS